MATDLIMKMSLENNLSPEIKKALGDLRTLTSNANVLKDTLQSFKDNKQGILKGSIKADTEELTQLQSKLAKVQEQYRKAETPAQRRNFKAEETQIKADLVSAYNREFTRLANIEKDARREIDSATLAIKKQSEELAKSAIETKKAELAKAKATESLKNDAKEQKKLYYDKIQLEKQLRAEESRLAQEALRERLAKRKREKQLADEEIAESKRLIEAKKQEANALRLAQEKQKNDNLSTYYRNTGNSVKLFNHELAQSKKAWAEAGLSSRQISEMVAHQTKQFKQQGVVVRNTSNEVVRHIRRLESLAVAIYAVKQGYDVTLGRGHEFNKLMESEVIGLKLLISQNLAHVDILGKAVTAQTRYNFAQKEASKAIELARKINVKTPHSFKETLQIFKLLTPQVLKYGGTLEDVAETTQKMSVIAASMGIEFQQFLKTVDSALSGEMKESGLKRALEQFGVTNEGIKELKKRNGDVVGYVMKGLEQAKSAGVDIFGSWQGIIGQFSNEWDDLFGKLQKPIFEQMKVEIKSLTKTLHDNKQNILDTVEAIGTLVKHLSMAVLAYGGVRIGTVLLTKATALYSSALTRVASSQALASRYASAYGKNISVAQIAVRNFARSLKALALTNAPMLLLVGAFEAYNLAMAETEERLERVASASKKTKEELALLGEQQLKNTKSAVVEQLREVEETIKSIEKSKKSIGASIMQRGTEGSGYSSLAEDAEHIGYLKAFTGSEKEIRDALQEQYEIRLKEKKELEKTLGLMNDITPAMQGVLNGAKYLEEAITNTNSELSKQTSIINNSTDAQSKETLEAVAKKEELEKQLELQKEGLKEANKLLVQAGLTRIEYKGMKEEVGGVSKELEKASKLAYELKVALIEGMRVNDGISNVAAIKKEHIAKVQLLNDTKTGMELEVALLQEQNRYRKESREAHEAMATERKNAEKSLNSLTVSNLEAHGKAKEALELKIQMVKDEEIPLAEKLLKIDTLRQEFANNKNKANSSALKKDLKDADTLLRKYYELTGQRDKIFQMDVDKTLGDLKKGGFTPEQLSKAYDGMWKKYKEEGEKANKKIAMDFTDQFKGLLESIFDGDLVGAIGGFFDGVATEVMAKPIDNMSKSLSGKMTGMFSGLGDFGGILGGLAISGIGSLIGSIFSDTVSQAEIDAAKGRVEFDDNSLRNLGSIFENAQYPMLEVTNKMHRHIRNMDANFYSVARALNAEASAGGVDLTGVNFVDTMEEGFLGFSSKSVSLISSGLSFATRSLEQMMNQATLGARGYTTTLVEESSWFGLDNDTSIEKTYKNLPKSVREDMSNSFREGFEAILTAGTTLGLDKINLEEALRNAKIRIGDIDFTGLSPDQVSDRLSQTFSTALSGVVDGISDFSILVSRYAKNSEYSLETLVRISTEYDQASHFFGLIGKDFKDGWISVTKEWSETTTVEKQGMFSSWLGALGTTFQSALGGMTNAFAGGLGGFFGALTGTTETITQYFSQTTQQVYTAQMQMLDIVESTGGMTEFQDAMNAYMSGFYTEAEQLGFMTKSMEQSFATLGLRMPKTNEEFRTLLETMDTSTEAGAYLYGQVLLLAEGFNQMTDASDNLLEQTRSNTQAMQDELEAMIKSVADAWLGNLSYLTLAQKAEYASGYLEYAKQSNGEISTIDSARAMAEIALKTSSTKEEYIPVFERYITELEKQAPEATTDDVVYELRMLRAEIVELKEANTDAYIYTGTN